MTHRVGHKGRALFHSLAGWLVLVGGICSPPLARAEVNYEITPAVVAVGGKMTWFQCPCYRWVVQAQVGGFAVATREFFISSDALLRAHQEIGMDATGIADRLFSVGALDALWKGGHVGLGFDGVTLGEDLDKGFTHIFKTGFYGFANLLLRQGIRIDARTGYHFEKEDVNQLPEQRGMIVETGILRWQSRAWKGNLIGKIGQDATHITDTSRIYTSASTAVEARLFDFHTLEMGLGFNLSYERDGWRTLMGQDPKLATFMIMMDLSSVAGNEAPPHGN